MRKKLGFVWPNGDVSGRVDANARFCVSQEYLRRIQTIDISGSLAANPFRILYWKCVNSAVVFKKTELHFVVHKLPRACNVQAQIFAYDYPSYGKVYVPFTLAVPPKFSDIYSKTFMPIRR